MSYFYGVLSNAQKRPKKGEILYRVASKVISIRANCAISELVDQVDFIITSCVGCKSWKYAAYAVVISQNLDRNK